MTSSIDYWASLSPEEQDRLDRYINGLVDEKIMQAMREVVADLKGQIPPEVNPYDFAHRCIRQIAPILDFVEDLRGESGKVVPFSKPKDRDGIPF